MEKLWTFNKFNFLKKHFLIKEDSEFNQYQFGGGVTNPLGPGYGFAVDPKLSIYGSQDSPYVDQYARSVGITNTLTNVLSFIKSDLFGNKPKFDYFLEDLDFFKNLKILRIYRNANNNLNIYISFDLRNEEFFGVFKDYNYSHNKPKLYSDLFTDMRFRYINQDYILKLQNYFYHILKKWFIPNPGFYTVLKDNLIVKDEMGKEIPIKIGSILKIKRYDENNNGEPYVILFFNDKKYFINGNDYYFIKYWLEPYLEE